MGARCDVTSVHVNVCGRRDGEECAFVDDVGDLGTLANHYIMCLVNTHEVNLNRQQPQTATSACNGFMTGIAMHGTREHTSVNPMRISLVS